MAWVTALLWHLLLDCESNCKGLGLHNFFLVVAPCSFVEIDDVSEVETVHSSNVGAFFLRDFMAQDVRRQSSSYSFHDNLKSH
jgi:hypothetical protein